MIRKVYRYDGGKDREIYRVPVAEYRTTLTDHGMLIDADI